MKINCLAFLLLSSIAALPVLAEPEDLNHNVVTQFAYTKAEQGSFKTDSKSVLLIAYLEELAHGSQPFTQAEFLQRSASVRVLHADLEAETPFGLRDGEATAFDIQLTTLKHWVIGAGHKREKLDGLSKDVGTSFSFGRYLSNYSRLLFSYGKSRNESRFAADSNTYIHGVRYKNASFQQNGDALTLDMVFTHIDAAAGISRVYSVEGEYHFNLASSVTLQTELTAGHDRGRQYTLGANQFFTNFFAVGAKFSHLDSDDKANTKTFSLYTRLLI